MSEQQGSSTTDTPYAVGSQHFGRSQLSRWRTPLAVLAMGTVLLLAATGVLGGGPSHVERASAAGVQAEIQYDPIVRSGNWFETQVTVRSAADVKDLTIAVDAPLWRQLSIDTMVPDAESAEAVDGRFAYHFGEVKAGEAFRLKLDGQIQPGLMREQSGIIRVLEGAVEPARELVAVPMRLRVLP